MARVLLDRGERARLLTRVGMPDARRLVQLVLDGSLGDLEILVPPTVGVVMARAADGVRGDVFNLGEVVVSQARVSLAGSEGWAMILGREAEHALALAILDAAVEAEHPAAERIEQAISELAAAADLRVAEELNKVAGTRVHFEVF